MVTTVLHVVFIMEYGILEITLIKYCLKQKLKKSNESAFFLTETSHVYTLTLQVFSLFSKILLAIIIIFIMLHSEYLNYVTKLD